jgi:hypothetical protein
MDSMVLMRPNTPITNKQRQAFAEEVIRKSQLGFGAAHAIPTFLRELFIPKTTQRTPSVFPCNNNKDICTTQIANAYAKATDNRVHPTKNPAVTVGADFLREGSNYKPVGSFIRKGFKPFISKQKYAPLKGRALIGAGMAGTTYAATEEPELLAAIPAAIAGPMLIRHLVRKNIQGQITGAKQRERAVSRAFPSVADAIGASDLKGENNATLTRKFKTRTLPAGVISALLGYGGVKGIERLIRGPETTDSGEDKMAEDLTNQDPGLTGGDIAQGAAVGAAGLAPLAGMIGQKKIVHDPLFNRNIARTKTIQDLARMARPGDVVITTTDGYRRFPFKVPQSIISGTDFYHAEPVVRRANGLGETLSAGSRDHASWGPVSTKRVFNSADPMNKHLVGDNILLMRPKKPLSRAEHSSFMNEMGQRLKQPYDAPHNIPTWLHDLVVPKVTFGTPKVDPCRGKNICSTLPAQAFATATGKRITSGKNPTRTLPADFLREDSAFEPVAAHIRRNNVGIIKNPIRSRLLGRGAIGLGSAGLMYGATEKPEIPAALVGALGTEAIANKLYRHSLRNVITDSDKRDMHVRHKIPVTWSALDAIGDKTPYGRGVHKAYFSRTLPLMLAGGLASYGAVHGIRSLLNQNEAPEEVEKQSSQTAFAGLLTRFPILSALGCEYGRGN